MQERAKPTETIRDGNDAAMLAHFHSFADGGRSATLLSAHNPTYRRCRVRLFTCGDKGRVAAIINPRSVDSSGAPYGLLGFFESVDEQAVAGELLSAASAWLISQGCSTVRGPIDFTTFHNYRFTIAGADMGAIPGEPVHPSYYPQLWEGAGFTQAATYRSNWTGDPQRHIDRFAPGAAGARAKGYSIRRTNADETDLELIYGMAMRAFSSAWMFSPIAYDEFRAVHSTATLEKARDAAYLVFSAEGEACGFFVGYPVVLEGRATQICKTVAAVPEHQGNGVYQLLGETWLREHVAAGIPEFCVALMHVDGAPSLLGLSGPETRIKEYAVYERSA